MLLFFKKQFREHRRAAVPAAEVFPVSSATAAVTHAPFGIGGGRRPCGVAKYCGVVVMAGHINCIVRGAVTSNAVPATCGVGRYCSYIVAGGYIPSGTHNTAVVLLTCYRAGIVAGGNGGSTIPPLYGLVLVMFPLLRQAIIVGFVPAVIEVMPAASLPEAFTSALLEQAKISPPVM